MPEAMTDKRQVKALLETYIQERKAKLSAKDLAVWQELENYQPYKEDSGMLVLKQVDRSDSPKLRKLIDGPINCADAYVEDKVLFRKIMTMQSALYILNQDNKSINDVTSYLVNDRAFLEHRRIEDKLFLNNSPFLLKVLVFIPALIALAVHNLIIGEKTEAIKLVDKIDPECIQQAEILVNHSRKNTQWRDEWDGAQNLNRKGLYGDSEHNKVNSTFDKAVRVLCEYANCTHVGNAELSIFKKQGVTRNILPAGENRANSDKIAKILNDSLKTPWPNDLDRNKPNNIATFNQRKTNSLAEKLEQADLKLDDDLIVIINLIKKAPTESLYEEKCRESQAKIQAELAEMMAHHNSKEKEDPTLKKLFGQ